MYKRTPFEDKGKQAGTENCESLKDEDDELLDDLDEDDDADLFHGRVVNLEKVRNYNKLCEAARWLYANSCDVQSIRQDVLTSRESNARVTLGLKRLSALFGETYRTFAYMTNLADSFFVTCFDDGIIRFTFGVEDVWQE